MAAGNPGPVLPERYAEALGDDHPLDVMASTPDALRKLVHGLTEAQLSKKPAPGKWCIKEIVAHLADGEVILGSRYRFTAALDRPAIQGYDQDAFAERLGALNAKTMDLIDDFAMVRAANLGLLERLPEEAWERVGIHSERGEESLAFMVHMYAGHDRVHLAQIETIRTGLFPKKKGAASGKAKAAPKKPAAKKRIAKTSSKKAAPKKGTAKR